MQTLSALPTKFAAGTTVKYTRGYSDFPPSGGWTAKLVLAGAVVLTINGAANPDGKNFDYTIPATGTPSTSQLAAGFYQAVERFTHATEGVFDKVLDRVEVTPDLTAATAGSLQSWLERAVVALRARIEGRLQPNQDMERFVIEGREVDLVPIEECVRLLNRFESQLREQGNTGSVSITLEGYFGSPQ